jgi:hypothetical protein
VFDRFQTFDALALTVKSEEKGGETILESKIQTEDIYQLQQGTTHTLNEQTTITCAFSLFSSSS